MNFPAPQYLPPEALLDEHHPHNTGFFRQLNSIKRAMVTAQSHMKQKHVEIIKQASLGTRNKDIAEELGVHAATVGKVIRSEQGKELLTLIRHLSALNEGPSSEQRKRTLWEIVVDNQDDEPKTAIAAIAEMNKMDGIGKEINATLFPKGALDG